MTTSSYYRAASAVALGTALFLLFGIGALGVIGDGGRPDLLYLGVVALGVVLALASRLRPAGMALALAATALGTLLVGIVAVAAGLHEGGSAFDVIMLSAMYAALFGASAWLFRRAARGATAGAA